MLADGCLAFIAEQLGINEGFSLNVAKTKVYTRAEFLSRLKHLVTDVADVAESAALDSLTSNLYFDAEPDPDELEKAEEHEPARVFAGRGCSGASALGANAKARMAL